LQERLLSPRLLHYASSQMFWECTHGIQSEDGCFFPRIKPDGSAFVHGIGNFVPEGMRTLMPFAAKSRETPLLLSSLADTPWTALIEEYSQRLLTKEQDKLPALSGLARVYGARFSSSYLAGLWQNQLGLHLCWRVYTREEVFDFSCDEHRQSEALRYGKTLSSLVVPTTYCAPSWSWASIHAAIRFEYYTEQNRLFDTVTGEVGSTGDNTFGKIQYAFLELVGPLIGILAGHPDEKSIEDPLYGVPLVAYFPHYYYEAADSFDLLENMPCGRCREGFTFRMEKNAMGSPVSESSLQIVESPGSNYPDGSQTEDEKLAIAEYMQQINISSQPAAGSHSSYVQFYDADRALAKMVTVGTGYFDVEPVWPCVALFLDDRYCLLLQPLDDDRGAYKRVGLGHFQPQYNKVQPVNRDSPTRVVMII